MKNVSNHQPVTISMAMFNTYGPMLNYQRDPKGIFHVLLDFISLSVTYPRFHLQVSFGIDDMWVFKPGTFCTSSTRINPA